MVDSDKCLEKLDRMIDQEHLKQSEILQERAWDYKEIERLPLLLSSLDDMSKESTPFTDWPLFTYSEIFRDPAKMLLDELRPIYEGALLKDDKMYTIRANYGVGIIPSLLGCQIFQEGKEMPWIEPLNSLDKVKELLDKGIPKLDGFLMEKVIDTERYFQKKLGQFPNLKKSIHLSMCDVQGPLNLATLILGQNIFLELYDHPEVIQDFLEFLTQIYIKVAQEQKETINEDMTSGYHFQYKIKGGVRISEDHGLSLSLEHYRIFCRPYNEKIFAAFGGGYILLCDNPIHVIDDMLNNKFLTAITYWSKEVEDLCQIYERAKDRKIPILWYGVIPETYRSRFPTGVIIKQRISSLEEGKRLISSNLRR